MPSLTFKGEEYLLYGTALNGGIANLAAHLRLYTGASTPMRDGTGFSQMVADGWYTPLALTRSHFIFTPGAVSPLVSTSLMIQVPGVPPTDPTWTVSGSTLAQQLAGAYLTDAAGAVLAWWERSGGAVTVGDGDTIVLDDLTVRLP